MWTEDGSLRDLAECGEATRVTELERAGLDALRMLAAEQGDPIELGVEQRCRFRAAESEALGPLARAYGDLARTMVALPDDDLDALRRIQEPSGRPVSLLGCAGPKGPAGASPASRDGRGLTEPSDDSGRLPPRWSTAHEGSGVDS
ncbi:hypothetical protein AB0E76_14455 [Streptomyces fungicidicus]|uniref:hypothetical protein n=1 Tax=Streptomyces fungicidicus TaxID=68203 RepID=UPI0033C1B459